MVRYLTTNGLGLSNRATIEQGAFCCVRKRDEMPTVANAEETAPLIQISSRARCSLLNESVQENEPAIYTIPTTPVAVERVDRVSSEMHPLVLWFHKLG